MKLTNIKNKKAQGGKNAAILIIVMTVLLVIFILSLPPEDRKDLLEGNNATWDPDFGDSTALLRANPGKIKYMPQNERIHEFAPFNLNADTHAKLIHTKSSTYIKNSVFEKITDTLTFNINLQETSNLILNFNVEKASGSLIIKLNNQIIYNAPISTGNSPPINLPKSLLQQENKLEFEVSGTGAAFWRYNFYELKNINIYGDVLDLSQSKSTQVFNVERQEANEIESSELRYLATCTPGKVKDMRININNFQIFSGIPDCELFNTIPIPTQYLFEGVNEITFQIREGQMLIDRARILNSLEEPSIKTYYFEVRDRYFDLIDDFYEIKPEYESMMDITFPNSNQKRFEIIFNGKPMNFNTARLRETRNLQMFLQPGTNSIQIIPKTELDITQIRVGIRER